MIRNLPGAWQLALARLDRERIFDILPPLPLFSNIIMLLKIDDKRHGIVPDGRTG